MTVRTQHLGEVETPALGGTAILYEAPAGRTAIVKDLTAYGGSSGAVAHCLHFGGGYPVIFEALTTGVARSFQRFIVLEPGQYLRVDGVVASPVLWTCSGTLLLGAPS